VGRSSQPAVAAAAVAEDSYFSRPADQDLIADIYDGSLDIAVLHLNYFV